MRRGHKPAPTHPDLLDRQQRLDRDLGRLVNLVASISEPVSKDRHCRAYPQVAATVMIRAPSQ